MSANTWIPSASGYRHELLLRRLPFVDAVPNDPDPSLWAVPRTGGLIGGCATGNAFASIYLKHLRKHGCHPDGALHRIALDMLGLPKSAGLLGQAIGFFRLPDFWLETVARSDLGSDLDQQDARALLEVANAGLSLEDEEDAEA